MPFGVHLHHQEEICPIFLFGRCNNKLKIKIYKYLFLFLCIMHSNNPLKIPANFLNTPVFPKPKLSPIQYVFLFFIRIFIQLKRLLGYKNPSMKERPTTKNINDQYFDKEYMRFLRLYERSSNQVGYEPRFSEPEGYERRIIQEGMVGFEKSIINEEPDESSVVTNKNTDKEFYDIKKYEDMMMIENNDIEIKWRTRILIENTPRGNIMMYYNSFKRGFAYYSDQQGVPYVILNTMAMKYVRVFQCRDLFMDDKVTPEDSPSPFIQIYKDDEKNALKSKIEETPVEQRIDRDMLKSGPFAKLKKYNMMTEDNNHKQSADMKETLDKPTNLNHGLVENNINRFLYMGKLTNSSVLQRTPNKKIVMVNNNQYDYMFEGEHELQKEVLSYSDFKKKLNNS